MTVEALLVTVVLMLFAITIFTIGEAITVRSYIQAMLDNTAIYMSGKDMGITNDNVEQKAEETIQLFGLPAEFYTFDTSFKGSKVEDGKLTLVLSYEYRDFDFLGLLDPIKVVQKSETVLW